MSSSLTNSAARTAPAANTTAVPEGRSASASSQTGRHAALLLGPPFRSTRPALPAASGAAVTELEPHWAAAIEAATD